MVQSRTKGKSKRVTVGLHGEIAPDQARKEAVRLIARIKAGEPLTEKEPEPTVADLAERYQREYVDMHNKPATASHYRIMLRKHIVPVLGEFRMSEVERKHILKFQYGLSEKPTVANRTVDILVKMFNLAELWEMRPPGRNPCKSVRRYKVEPHKEWFLIPDELGRMLDAAPHSTRRRRSGFCCRPGAGATRFWGWPVRTRISRRARCASRTVRQARGSFGCRASPAIRGCSPAERRAPIKPTSTTRGTASAGAPASTASVFMTSDTRSPHRRSRSARACR